MLAERDFEFKFGNKTILRKNLLYYHHIVKKKKRVTTCLKSYHTHNISLFVFGFVCNLQSTNIIYLSTTAVESSKTSK